MYSKTVLVGRFARDPEVSTTTGQNPKAKAVFTIAWDHPFKKGNSQFTKCVAWGKTAETVGKYCKKGRTILVEGIQVNNTWEKTIGNETFTMYSSELEVDQVRFIDAANNGSNSNEQQSQQQPAWGSQGFGRIEQQPTAQQPQVQQPQVQQPQAPQQPQFSNPGQPVNQPGMNPQAFQQQQPQYTPQQIQQIQQQQMQQQFNQQQQQPQVPPAMQQNFQQQPPAQNFQQPQNQPLPPQNQQPYPGVEADDLPF